MQLFYNVAVPLLFGLLLIVVNSFSTHSFNIVNAFSHVVLLPSTEGYFNGQRQLWVMLRPGILVIYCLDAALPQLPQGMVLVRIEFDYGYPSKVEHW